jgi:hypothetical protein
MECTSSDTAIIVKIVLTVKYQSARCTISSSLIDVIHRIFDLSLPYGKINWSLVALYRSSIVP